MANFCFVFELPGLALLLLLLLPWQLEEICKQSRLSVRARPIFNPPVFRISDLQNPFENDDDDDDVHDDDGDDDVHDDDGEHD